MHPRRRRRALKKTAALLRGGCWRTFACANLPVPNVCALLTASKVEEAKQASASKTLASSAICGLPPARPGPFQTLQTLGRRFLLHQQAVKKKQLSGTSRKALRSPSSRESILRCDAAPRRWPPEQAAYSSRKAAAAMETRARSVTTVKNRSASSTTQRAATMAPRAHSATRASPRRPPSNGAGDKMR